MVVDFTSADVREGRRLTQANPEADLQGEELLRFMTKSQGADANGLLELFGTCYHLGVARGYHLARAEE